MLAQLVISDAGNAGEPTGDPSCARMLAPQGRTATNRKTRAGDVSGAVVDVLRDHVRTAGPSATVKAVPERYPSPVQGDQMGAGAELIKQTYEAFGRGDIPAVLDNVAEDVQWSAPGTVPQGGQFQGRSGVMRFFQGMGGAWETLGLDVEAVSEAGEDIVVGIVRADGTLRGGGPSGYGAVHVFTVREGKIARFREYTDLNGPLN